MLCILVSINVNANLVSMNIWGSQYCEESCIWFSFENMSTLYIWVYMNHSNTSNNAQMSNCGNSTFWALESKWIVLVDDFEPMETYLRDFSIADERALFVVFLLWYWMDNNGSFVWLPETCFITKSTQTYASMSSHAQNTHVYP